MKKIIFIYIVLLSFSVGGCSTDTNMSANANRTNTRTAITPSTSQMNLSNAMADTATRPTESTSANRRSNSAANYGNNRATNTNVAATPAQTPAQQKGEKKDEGLFSFPPPKVISYSVINNSDLLNKEGQTTFAQVSDKLAAGLNRAGYTTGEKYSYFWSEKDEFAIVTAMERVNPSGSRLENGERWLTPTLPPRLPKAHSWSEYFEYLISGKKVYYRVFAFVVTSKRTGQSFNRNSPPDFTMARNWMNKGGEVLGEGESTTIGDVIFDERYKCYALLYLFVNHTRLDSPKSLDTLTINEEGLTDGVNQQAKVHLEKTQIHFGE